MYSKTTLPELIALTLTSVLLAGTARATEPPVVEVGSVATPLLSVPARTLSPPPEAAVFSREINRRSNPNAGEPDEGRRGTWNRGPLPRDPLIGLPAASSTPPPELNIEGIGSGGGVHPPDVVGATGPGHYVQMVNATTVRVLDKAGATLGSFALGELWPVGQACRSNHGDPIPVYDQFADRWLLSQFRSGSPNRMCIAISQTADPLGEYYIYTFDVPQFPDYFKFGVWPDGYYMSSNESNYVAYAFDRVRMLEGEPATSQRFAGQSNLLLPADIDGPELPPEGTPGLFYTFKDNSFHGGSDRLELFAFTVDWDTPANSSFTLIQTLPLTSFTYTPCGAFNFNCVRQLGTSQRLDTIAEWPMFRFAYRHFDSHQTAVGAFTIGGGAGEVGAAIRWFEVRNEGDGWSLFQEGTFDPDDGLDRWNPSIAMDRDGNMALGYSVGASSIHTRIAYTTRLATDPPGTMAKEMLLIQSSGPHTSNNRWGDYSAMTVDPADDCTFWYTNEYMEAGSTAFRTRIGTFRIPDCGTPDGLFANGFEQAAN